MASTPLDKIEGAHQMYRAGRYREALGLYTEALSVAKTKTQKIALHSNRAACFLKLHDFKKAAEECTSVLELDHKHTGALMLRAQTLVTLKEYHSALFDVNRLMELNPSSEVYQNLEARLRTQLSLASIPESEAELEEEEEDDEAEACSVQHVEGQGSEMEGAIVSLVGRERQADINRNSASDEVIPKPTIPQCSPDQRRDQKADTNRTSNDEVSIPVPSSIRESSEQGRNQNAETKSTAAGLILSQEQSIKKSSEPPSKGWQTIPKPKGHSSLDYARWDRVEDDSSEDDEDDDEETTPQYRFRLKTVGVRPVK